MSGSTIVIRNWTLADDVAALTAMLHRAYAVLAARGLRYSATHQSSEVTQRRVSRGTSFVAEIGGRPIGTITTYRPDPEATVPTYREPSTFHFGQFGVDPDFKGRGVGRSLHQTVIEHAIKQRARFMALDTAAPATDLIATYERWGYSIIGRTKWEDTNYESVIMRCALPNGLGNVFKPAK